jgi:hypothetical protein
MATGDRGEHYSKVLLCFVGDKQRAQMGEQSQAPKQALGVVTLHAICEEWHVVVPEPALQVVCTGPLPTRPCPAMMFLRPFVEKRTARSWVNDSPATATLTQSAA